MTVTRIGERIRFYRDGSYFNGILTAIPLGLDRGSHVRVCVPHEHMTIPVPIRACESQNGRAVESDLLGFSATVATRASFFEGVISTLLWIDDVPFVILANPRNSEAHSGFVELSVVEVGMRHIHV